MIESKFFIPRDTVTFINYDKEYYSSLHRFVLESAGCLVRHYFIGTPNDLLLLLQSEDVSNIVILSGHGAAGKGLQFSPKYSKAIDSSMLVDGYMPASVIKTHWKAEKQLIFGLFCDSAEKSMVEAWCNNGKNIYIGESYPNTRTPFYPVLLSRFFYEYRCNGKSVYQSYELAVSLTDSPDASAWSIHGDLDLAKRMLSPATLADKGFARPARPRANKASEAIGAEAAPQPQR